MSDTLISSLSDLQDIAGLYLLGRGLNRLDWTGKRKECQKVGDTFSDKRALHWQDSVYTAGKHVDFSPLCGEDSFVATFACRERYEQHVQSQLTGSGCYGAFSAGFSTTFGTSLDRFVNQTAALYSHRINLWTLSLPATPHTATHAFKERLSQLPSAFDSANPKPYVDFLVEFGVDIVTEATVGAALNYAVTCDSRELDDPDSLADRVKAEYEAFVGPRTEAPISERLIRNIGQRRGRLTTVGGHHRIGFDADAPHNCHSEVVAWRDSVPKAPHIVTLNTTPVFHFVEPGARRDALEQAWYWYTGLAVQINAYWQDSHIVMDQPVQQDDLNTGNGPSLRIVLLDGQTRQAFESRHRAPLPNADAGTFERYWAAVALLLEQKQRQGYKLLLSTDRWPRDSRYCPGDRMRQALLQYGAQTKTLEQWERLCLHMQPCALAGLTYALVGNDDGQHGFDGVVAGFGTPGKNLNPTVRISARFAHDSFGKMKALKRAETVVDAQTRLYAIHNRRGNRLVLGCDPEDKTRVSLQARDSGNGRQHWYMPQQEQRYQQIRRPTLLINFETGTCLQGQRDGSDSLLVPLGTHLQDDLLWDLRGEDENFHLLLVYYFPDALHLTQYNAQNAAVRGWREDGMDWARKPVVP